MTRTGTTAPDPPQWGAEALADMPPAGAGFMIETREPIPAAELARLHQYGTFSHLAHRGVMEDGGATDRAALRQRVERLLDAAAHPTACLAVEDVFSGRPMRARL